MVRRNAMTRGWSVTSVRTLDQTAPTAPEAPRTGGPASGDRSCPGQKAAPDDPARVRAYVRAHGLMERAQGGLPVGEADTWIAESVDRDWPDIQFLLHYALLMGVRQTGENGAAHLARMYELVESGDDPVLLALTLATAAERPPDDGTEADLVESDLARAVAVLEDGSDSVVERAAGFVACALAYHARGLWELEEDMYQRAGDTLLADPPPELAGIQRQVQRVVLFNRREALLAGACARWEAGDRDGARDLARHGLALPVPAPADQPGNWLNEIAAAVDLLAAIAAVPTPPVPQPPGVAGVTWPGYRGLVLLAQAIRAAEASDPQASAALAEQALATFTSDLIPSAHLLAGVPQRLGVNRPAVRRRAGAPALAGQAARGRIGPGADRRGPVAPRPCQADRAGVRGPAHRPGEPARVLPLPRAAPARHGRSADRRAHGGRRSVQARQRHPWPSGG